jgi:hypothetical protein
MRPEDFVSVRQLATLLGNANSASLLTRPSATNNGQVNAGNPNLILPLNVDFLRGFPDSAFAKLDFPNTFQEAQSMGGGARLPATVPDPAQTNFLDSAELDFESSIVQQQNGTYTQQLFRWSSQPTNSSSGTPTARLSLFFGQNAVPQPTGLSVNSDGTINFAPGQTLPSSAVMQAMSTGQSESVGPGSNGGYGNPIVNTAPYTWTETPSGSAIKAGPNTVTLAPCPKGVNGADLWHYLYIAKTGKPEAVLITGGSCVSRAKSGTIEFTALYDHPAGYSIGSATDGVQEALIDADAASKGGQQLSRNVQIDPGSHIFHARLSVRATGLTISASAATITCAMQDTCIMLGDPANTNLFQNVAVSGLRVIAGIFAGTWPALEDNANSSVITDLAPLNASISGASFGSLVQVDNDQAAKIIGLTTIATAWARCDTSFCSTAIVGPGANGDAGIIWVQDSNLSLNCSANGIDNHNGNGLNVTNTVVQAFPEFGIRARGIYSNNPSVQLATVHEEIGNCVSPIGTGMAGLIVEGGYANVTATVGPTGQLPVFANTGTTQYNYSIVVHSSTWGSSPVYLAGYAYTSGAGSIPVVWNQIGNTGVVTYDILRTTGSTTPAPFGTGSFAIATGIPASSCVNSICSFTDNAGSQPSLYTVSTDTPYWVSQKLWPGSVILTTASDYENTGGGTPTLYYTDNLNTGAGIVSSAGGFEPSVFATSCNSELPMSSIWIQCLGGNASSNDNPAVTATVLQSAGNAGNRGGLKGRLIFEMPPNAEVGATQIVTLQDSNPTKTMATPNNRPSWDPSDAYLGFDNPPGTPAGAGTAQLSMGAPVSISHYIGNTGDNISWGERLTKSSKTFQVPVYATGNVTVDGNLYLNGSCLGGGCGPLTPSGAQVTDNFHRPNGTLGPDWTVTAGTWSISNNQATYVGNGTSDDSALAAYTGGTFASSQSATAQVVFSPEDGTTAAGVGVRMSAMSETGYVCFASQAETTILKYDSGARSGLGGVGPGLRSGDYLTAQVTGNSSADISCLDNGVPIPGVGAIDSSSPLTSGYPGIFGEYVFNSFLDNFSAQSLTYTTNGLITFGAGLQTAPVPFSAVTPCSSSTEGTLQAVLDSNTKSLGATITSGNGPYHALAYCDGSNLIVATAAQ